MENSYDNSVILWDEDGNEVEFEIVHYCTYKGDTYCVLWSEDDDGFVIVRKDGEDDYDVVDDDEITEYVSTDFKKGMGDLMDEVDAFAIESDFMEEMNSILNDDSASTNRVKEDDDSSFFGLDMFLSPFDKEKYLRLSKDFSFAEANNFYVQSDYEEAIASFEKARNEGNVFALAHLGIMNYYGYGCLKDRKVAFQLFSEGAKNGCPLAAAWLADCYRLGHGVEKDTELSDKIFTAILPSLREMCDAGDRAASYFLGFNLVMGIGVKVDDDEGAMLLKKAFDKGEKRAAVQLADCYYHGWGVPKDPNKTVELLMTNPMPNNSKAQYLLGLCNYYGDGTEKNRDRAFLHFKAAAALGHGGSKDYLGDCYYNGHGTNVDFVEAFKWYKDAADNNGVGSAAHSLAFMYLNGEGVHESEKEAMRYFLLAAEKGIAQAQRIISQEYLSGDNFEHSYKLAREWMEKAAEQGDPEAQLMLGRYYISDFGFDDESKAFEWFMKAANQGNAEAEWIVGGCYENGMGTTEDFVEANKWYSKAVKHEYAQAYCDLGKNYILGKGIDKNSTKGVDLLSQAVNAGITGANKILAKLYYYGIDNYNNQIKYVSYSEAYKYALEAVKDDKDGDSQFILASILNQAFGKTQEAAEWYARSANNGNDKAMLELSKMYIMSMKQLDNAFEMLQKLANKNNAEAQYYLAICYENGYGCVKDKKLAKGYYQKASRNGYSGEGNQKKKKFGFFN